MAGSLIIVPNYMPARNRDGDLVPGALMFFYVNGTTTLTTVYANAALSIPLTNPVPANASGVFPLIYGAQGSVYSVRVTDALGNPLAGYDNVNSNDAAIFTTTGRTLGQVAVDLGFLTDYLPGAGDGVTDCAPTLNTLFATGNKTIRLTGNVRVNSTVLIPAGVSNITLIFEPGSAFYSPSHVRNLLQISSTSYNIRTYNFNAFTNGQLSGVSTRVYAIVDQGIGSEHHGPRGVYMHSGMLMRGPKFKVFDAQFTDICIGNGVGCTIDQGSNEVGEFLRCVIGNANPASNAYAGVEVLSGADLTLSGRCFKTGTGLLLNPGSGQIIATLRLDGFNGDTGNGNGMWITGPGTIQRLEGDVRVSSMAGDGYREDTIPQSADLSIRAVDNTLFGANLAVSGNRKNGRYRVAGYGNDSGGVNVSANSSYFRAEVTAGDGDGFGTNGGYGMVIGTGCDHFTVDIDGDGGPSGLINNLAGTSATKVVRSRA